MEHNAEVMVTPTKSKANEKILASFKMKQKNNDSNKPAIEIN